MHSSKIMVASILVAAVAAGFAPGAVIAANTSTTQTSEYSKVIADMKEDIRKLKEEVAQLKQEMAERKARAKQKYEDQVKARKDQEAAEMQGTQ